MKKAAIPVLGILLLAASLVAWRHYSSPTLEFVENREIGGRVTPVFRLRNGTPFTFGYLAESDFGLPGPGKPRLYFSQIDLKSPDRPEDWRSLPPGGQVEVEVRTDSRPTLMTFTASGPTVRPAVRVHRGNAPPEWKDPSLSPGSPYFGKVQEFFAKYWERVSDHPEIPDAVWGSRTPVARENYFNPRTLGGNLVDETPVVDARTTRSSKAQ